MPFSIAFLPIARPTALAASLFDFDSNEANSLSKVEAETKVTPLVSSIIWAYILVLLLYKFNLGFSGVPETFSYSSMSCFSIFIFVNLL